MEAFKKDLAGDPDLAKQYNVKLPEGNHSAWIHLTLSHMQTHYEAIAADDFWKHCGQGQNCSWWAISPLATMFSTSFDN